MIIRNPNCSMYFTYFIPSMLLYSTHTKFTKIDFISIDAEGSDYRILEQIDLKALNCKMVCVEYNNIDGMKYVKYMEQFGFRIIMMNGCNIIMAL